MLAGQVWYRHLGYQKHPIWWLCLCHRVSLFPLFVFIYIAHQLLVFFRALLLLLTAMVLLPSHGLPASLS